MGDSLHLWGIGLIQEIQSRLEEYSGLLVFLSHIGDPRFAFSIYFPVAYFLHRSVGKRVLWVAVISEWLNAVAKWLLHGERPYWWVHESGLYKKDQIPHLQQFNITCETGPGSPSGHAMITSAVWYILVSDLLYYKQAQSVLTHLACWACYLLVMFAVCVSRLFIATHFPHQVIAGIFSGMLLGKILNSLSTTTLTFYHYVVTSALLSIIAASIYMLVGVLGYDPLWSVVVATKWCAFREWVHMDTTLFYSIVRDISSLLGLGVAGTLFTTNEKSIDGPVKKICQIALALFITMTTDKLKASPDDIFLFYFLGFAKHFIVVFIIAALVPALFVTFPRNKLFK
ncbi:unnamed protein product [Lymnaea stagnalis]|uniref:Glucose-6-phosphatase n=1 Tax=Lymnaea stagnalis TaxID=6523 RepID=A0AAV2HC10_LYMST